MRIRKNVYVLLQEYVYLLVGRKKFKKSISYNYSRKLFLHSRSNSHAFIMSFKLDQIRSHEQRLEETKENLSILRENAPSMKSKGKIVYDYFYKERFLDKEVFLVYDYCPNK
jgi:hypothetical protein